MKDKKSIADVLRQIAEDYGENIFLEQRRVYAILSDLAPGDFYAKQRRRIKMSLEAGSVEILLKAKKDKDGAELYINESVNRLINNTDMAEDIAKETIALIAEALSVTPAEVSNKRKKGLKSKEKRQKAEKQQQKGKEISKTGKYAAIGIFSLCGAVAVLALAVLFVNLNTIGKQWFIGIGSGAVLAVGVVGLAFLIESKIYNEKCQTITISLPILFAANIVLRAVLGNSTYGLIFHIMSVWIVAGAVANIVLTRVELEEKWTWPNVAVALCSGFLLFLWPGDFSWTVWQWIIGIGGSLVLSAFAVIMSWILEEIGPEIYQSLSVMLILATIANLVLLFTLKQDYLIIAMCFMAVLTVGAIITTFMSFGEDAPVLGFINIVIAIINCGIFIILVTGSYRQFADYVQPLLDKIETKPTQS
ncbi:MAG: hypothetical protein PUF87_00765 [Ruminococcus sp.]|nr:hypothetical protein [Ruminococcus sp.]